MKLLTTSSATFDPARQQNADNNKKMAPTSITFDATIATVASAGNGAGGTGGAPPAVNGALAAGEHVPILHLATSFPAPTGDVVKAIQPVPLVDQRTQAEEFSLSWLRQVRRCHGSMKGARATWPW